MLPLLAPSVFQLLLYDCVIRRDSLQLLRIMLRQLVALFAQVPLLGVELFLYLAEFHDFRFVIL